MSKVISKSKCVIEKTVFDFATLLSFECVIYINGLISFGPNVEHIEDSELIARILSGDRRAFAVLVHRHSRQVYAQIARSVRLADDVEDLVQIVFVKVYENLDRLRDRDRFRAWLHRLVRNAVYSWHRRRAVQLRLEDALCQEPVESSDSEEEIGFVVRAALHTLPAEHRQVISHHYFKGYSYAETAELLDLTVETVRGRLKRARLKLKEELQTMSDISAQTFELNGNDIDALKKVGVFVGDDENRQMMQGICLDTGGRIIATNGHVLVIRTSEQLEAFGAPVILGPWKGVDLLSGDRATLTVGEERAEIQFDDRSSVQIPLIEGPFVQYEKVIPQEDPTMRISVSSDLLANALDLLQDHMEARHPESGEWRYRPQVALHLSPLAQTVTFLTSRDMGYTRPEEDGKLQSFIHSGEGISPGGAVDWTFQVPLDASFEVSSPEETLRLGVNFAYLKDVLQALDFEENGEMVLEFRGTLKAILFYSPKHPDWLALLMPLRLEASDAVE